MRVAAIVPAAGAGKRLKSKTPKAFVNVQGKPLLIRALRALGRGGKFHEFVVVVAKNEVASATRLLRRFRVRKFKVVPGGATRAESVWKGLQAVSKGSDWILVHDAARPLVSKDLVVGLLKAAKLTGGAICGMPIQATVKRVNLKSRIIEKTEDRAELYLAQTPQVFRKDLLIARYQKLGRSAFTGTDEAALFDGTSVNVRMVLGDSRNIKVTVPEDLALLEYLLLRGKR